MVGIFGGADAVAILWIMTYLECIDKKYENQLSIEKQ
jgi:hypothetical protein